MMDLEWLEEALGISRCVLLKICINLQDTKC